MWILNRTRAAATARVVLAGAVILLAASSARAAGPCDGLSTPAGSVGVALQMPLGGVCVELLALDAPATVANFLDYLDRGEIDGSFFHRSLPGFVVQGGGFRVTAGTFETVPPRLDADGFQIVVPNEPCSVDPVAGICLERGNERGTLALAKQGGDPNSGTTNWFVNLADNRSNLDNQNGGFTVFGRVLGSGMDVVDAIAALPQVAARPQNDDDLAFWANLPLSGVFENLPLVNLPPFDAAGTSFGCFRHDDLAVVVDPANPLIGLPDPVTGGFFFVAGACGTPVLLPDFVANPGSGSCLDADRLGVNVTSPTNLSPPTGQPVYFSLTCAETQEAVAQRNAWRADFTQRLHAELVTVDSAVRVPEPGMLALRAAAGLALAALHRRRRRSLPRLGRGRGTMGGGTPTVGG